MYGPVSSSNRGVQASRQIQTNGRAARGITAGSSASRQQEDLLGESTYTTKGKEDFEVKLADLVAQHKEPLVGTEYVPRS